jgi:hypothetical protein
MSEFPAPSEGGGCVASRVVSLCARCELRELACARAIVHRLAAGCFSECARGRSSEGLEASALRAARFSISSESNVGAVPIARRVGAAAKEGPSLGPSIASAELLPRTGRRGSARMNTSHSQGAVLTQSVRTCPTAHIRRCHPPSAHSQRVGKHRSLCSCAGARVAAVRRAPRGQNKWTRKERKYFKTKNIEKN